MMEQNISRLFSQPLLKCPTCGLTFHNQNQCRRCGTDLTLLMNTIRSAVLLRNQARNYLSSGEYQQALTLARKSEFLQKTPAGEILIRFIEHVRGHYPNR